MPTTNTYRTTGDLLYYANRRLAQSIGASSGPTFSMATSDTAQGFDPADLTDVNGNTAVAATIYCESNPVRIAFGGTVPTQSPGLGIPLAVGDTYYIDCPEDLNTFQVINQNNGSNGLLQVIPRF